MTTKECGSYSKSCWKNILGERERERERDTERKRQRERNRERERGGRVGEGKRTRRVPIENSIHHLLSPTVLLCFILTVSCLYGIQNPMSLM